MQCFQKDPNLRVSARKLLKHPWIVNARRSDSVVPKKSTEYEEAVKSVQEWNEALRSPNAGSLRKSLRSDVNSPAAGHKNVQHPRAIQTNKESLTGQNTKATAEKFRSPEGAADDNWDDDFTTPISPSALQLPHLRPHDNFGGMLSSEKLKAFASFESMTDSDFLNNSGEGESNELDPLQTIRPFLPKPPVVGHRRGKSSGRSREHIPQNAAKNDAPALPKAQGPNRRSVAHSRPAAFYKESSIEDYSDLIVADDAVLERKLSVVPVWHLVLFPRKTLEEILIS